MTPTGSDHQSTNILWLAVLGGVLAGAVFGDGLRAILVGGLLGLGLYFIATFRN